MSTENETETARDPILEAALIAAGHTLLHGDKVAQMRAALEVVAPYTRRYVAEEIADEIARHRATFDQNSPIAAELQVAEEIARDAGKFTECPSCHTHDGHPHTDYCKAVKA